MDLRIRNAQILLETTDSTISEIARIIGYENAMYFSRLFRRTKGLSPAHYRKACRKAASASSSQPDEGEGDR